MADALILPVAPADLSALVATHWQDAARHHGVDPERVRVSVDERDGELSCPHGRTQRAAALSLLARRLEDAGLVVERGAGLRVVGWAATGPHPTATGCHWCGKSASCFGAYEGMGEPAFACDECCGHGNEDGWCGPFIEPCSCPPPAIGDGPASCHACGNFRPRVFPLVRIASLPPLTDPRAVAYWSALAERRAAEAKAEGAAPDAKLEGARARWRAAYGQRTGRSER